MAKTLKLAALSCALAGSMGLAHGAPCTGGNTTGLDTSDVTYSVNGPGAGPFANANACFGYMSGNDNNANVNAAAVVAGWGNGFLQADKSDSAGPGSPISLFGGTFTFTIIAPETTSGLYTLSATDNNGTAPPNYPIALDFIAVLKGGPGYAGWFFDDVTFDGSGGGAWEINFLNPGKKIPDLSHMSIYVREGSSGSTGTVSTSGTISLSLLGLALMIGAHRMRKNGNAQT